jgi:hypothetical protein
VSSRRLPEWRRNIGSGLGSQGDLLSVSAGALEASADDQRGRSPFAGLRLRTDAAKRYKKVENATAVIWKMLLLAEQRSHRLDATDELMQVYLGFGFQERNEETETKQEETLAIA